MHPTKRARDDRISRDEPHTGVTGDVIDDFDDDEDNEILVLSLFTSTISSALSFVAYFSSIDACLVIN